MTLEWETLPFYPPRDHFHLIQTEYCIACIATTKKMEKQNPIKTVVKKKKCTAGVYRFHPVTVDLLIG
jgi:hypothetical protein